LVGIRAPSSSSTITSTYGTRSRHASPAGGERSRADWKRSPRRRLHDLVYLNTPCAVASVFVASSSNVPREK
jgi:hypothetical protein